jgi:hypothetical protein
VCLESLRAAFEIVIVTNYTTNGQQMFLTVSCTIKGCNFKSGWKAHSLRTETLFINELSKNTL